jgi:hypothetical protein
MSRRLLALSILATLLVTACGRVASTHPAAAGYRLFLEAGYAGGSELISVRDSGTGAADASLPVGTPAPDWSRYYTVTRPAGSTLLSALDPGSGRTVAQAFLPAGYALPDLGSIGPTGGISPDGRWLALTSQGLGPGGKTVTNFLVGSSSLTATFKPVRVDGDFSFDALSNDGQRLYLIQRMSDPNHYQVRLYDLGANALSPYPVVDKQDPKEPMTGIRGDSVADPLGNFVFTVYARDSGPFIHALPLDYPFAFCVDLPKDAANNIESQFRWSLAITRNGSTVYAANALLGRVAVMSTAGSPKIARTAPVAMNPPADLLAGLVTTADAKGAPIGGAALSADGRTLFAIGNTGIVAIDTASLQVRSRILPGESVDSIRLSSDGRWLYAAQAGANKVWQIDPRTGVITGEVKGVGMTSPWAVLWAAPKN